ncbi:hypothetical protein H0H87_008990 [Tephrocybe sp. NHM501043]|nr:hypothetical protein H0H87_008990 [Tephrocybe sp. NHM501043]
MIISSLLTIGQITFILRVAIQILAFVGPILISVIILASVSRVASIDTHGIINRIVSASSATKSTAYWVLGRLRHRHADPTPSSKFFLLLLLSLLFTAFVSLSDIGFLGFYACSIPVSDITDAPASISNTDAARSLILSNMVNGTNPDDVKVARCDSTTVLNMGSDIFLSSCTSWQNSTYGDVGLFKDLNTTDSDAMMPRRLTHLKQAEDKIDFSAFYVGPNTQRAVEPFIAKGLAVLPHDGGVRMIMGVPQLAHQKKVELSKAMAVEVEVGCMSIGVRDIELVENSQGSMWFMTNGTWWNYTGPAYLEEPLRKTVDDIRAYYQPFFNTSTLGPDGSMTSFNASSLDLTTTANVMTYTLPVLPSGLSTVPLNELMGSCTQRIEKALGITSDNRTEAAGDMCGLLGVGGSLNVNTLATKVFERMVCATTTQVNMVDATVGVDSDSQVSANITRLPSDLYYVHADYWTESFNDFLNASAVNIFTPYRRYTLNGNPGAPDTHFIHQPKTILNQYSVGIGSGGGTISSVGSIILGNQFFEENQYNALALLDDGLDSPVFEPSTAVRWIGEVGASFFLASLGYNGWAALQSAPVEVQSTGGRLGSCYKPHYALGFVPFVLAVFLLLGWMTAGMIGRSWFGTEVLDTGYGGVTPFAAVAAPGADPKKTLLAWEAQPEPRLQTIEKGYALTGNANETVVKYLKSAPSYM